MASFWSDTSRIASNVALAPDGSPSGPRCSSATRKSSLVFSPSLSAFSTRSFRISSRRSESFASP
jgi:hypothetical protein